MYLEKIIQRKLKIRQKAPAAVTAANHNQKCGPLDIFCFLGVTPKTTQPSHKKGLLRKIQFFGNILLLLHFEKN